MNDRIYMCAREIVWLITEVAILTCIALVVRACPRPAWADDSAPLDAVTGAAIPSNDMAGV